MNMINYLKAKEAVIAEDWDAVKEAVEWDVDTAVEIMALYEILLPAELKYQLACMHYVNKGDTYPVLRRILRDNRSCRPENWRDELPEAVRDNEVFTVYRAGSQTIDKVRYSMSWTLSRDVAEWFADRNDHYGCPEQHIYRATIAADKVIAYLNERNEFEIIQFRNVKNVVELPREGTSDEYNAITKINKHFTLETYQKEKEAKLEYINRKLKEAQNQTT